MSRLACLLVLYIGKPLKASKDIPHSKVLRCQAQLPDADELRTNSSGR